MLVCESGFKSSLAHLNAVSLLQISVLGSPRNPSSPPGPASPGKAQDRVQFFERVKDLIAHPLVEISLHNPDVAFCRALVARFSRPRRQDCKPHVIGKVAGSRIDIGVVEMRPVNSALEIVHHQVRRHPAKIGKHPLVQPDKRRQLLV